MARLIQNSYGKVEVRLTKVIRSGSSHEIQELTVRVMLGGAFDRVYTHGDNSACIPTDTMKNMVFVLAKKHDFRSPESFAGILADHFLQSFSHVASVEAVLRQDPWERIPVGSTPHRHAFVRAGSGTRTCALRKERSGASCLSGGLAGLEVLKTSGSGFSGFLRDEYTTLEDTRDRILATAIDAEWDYAPAAADHNALFSAARETLLEVFATHDSASVQQTLFVMGETLLARLPDITQVRISLPNRHRLPVDLSPFRLANGGEIFTATNEPFGLITGTIVRE